MSLPLRREGQVKACGRGSCIDSAPPLLHQERFELFGVGSQQRFPFLCWKRVKAYVMAIRAIMRVMYFTGCHLEVSSVGRPLRLLSCKTSGGSFSKPENKAEKISRIHPSRERTDSGPSSTRAGHRGGQSAVSSWRQSLFYREFVEREVSCPDYQ